MSKLKYMYFFICLVFGIYSATYLLQSNLFLESVNFYNKYFSKDYIVKIEKINTFNNK